MNFIEIIIAFIIIGFFLSGFSQTFLSAYNAWERAEKNYRTAQSINFIAKSFMTECAGTERNIERWKQSVSTVKELENYETNEYWQNGLLRAIKLTCIIYGEKIEIIGLCTP